MSLPSLDKKDSTTPINKNQFYTLTAVIIFILCLDVLMVKLPFYSISNRTSETITTVFGTAIVISIITQVLYFKISFPKNNINFGLFRLSDSKIKLIAIIIQCIIISLIITVFLQVVVTKSYYTILIKYIILLSSTLSIFFISLLSIRFISWFQASKSSELLMFSTATIAIIVNSIMVIIFAHFALMNVFDVMNPFIPSITNTMFNISGLKNVYLISTTIEFTLIWLASLLILKPFSSRIGQISFWTLMIIPIIFFTAKLQINELWLSNLLISSGIFSPVSFFRLASIFEVTTNVIVGLVFGLAYWIISRGISSNTLRQFVQISGIGICILFLSSQLTNLTLLPYPPFGLVSISFAGISSYLLFIGLYQSALITSKDSVIRSLIHKSANELRFIGNIGSSEMKHNITSQFKQVVKKYGEEIENDTDSKISDSDQDVKDFVAMALSEREKYLRNATVQRMYVREEMPFGKSWEKWVELWWQWCYSFSEIDSPVTDVTGEFSKKGQIYYPVWFLAGTFGGKAERSCSLSKQAAIFFPILNNIISYYTDPQLKTQSDLDGYAKADLDHANLISARLDGYEIPNIYSYRVHSHLFTVNVPKKNDKDLRVKTEAISEGYWLFLKPLIPGKHKLQFIGEKLEFDMIKDYQNFSDAEVNTLPKFRVEVTYNLEVI